MISSSHGRCGNHLNTRNVKPTAKFLTRAEQWLISNYYPLSFSKGTERKVLPKLGAAKINDLRNNFSCPLFKTNEQTTEEGDSILSEESAS